MDSTKIGILDFCNFRVYFLKFTREKRNLTSNQLETGKILSNRNIKYIRKRGNKR